MKAEKPTREELADRVTLCTTLIAAGCHDGEIKKAVSAKYGCSPRSVERYLRRAREDLIKRRNRSKGELQAESMAFYESVLRSKTATHRDRLFARKRIDELLGLEEPKKLELGGADGGPIKIDHSASNLSALMKDAEAAEALEVLANRSAGLAVASNGHARK